MELREAMEEHDYDQQYEDEGGLVRQEWEEEGELEEQPPPPPYVPQQYRVQSGGEKEEEAMARGSSSSCSTDESDDEMYMDDYEEEGYEEERHGVREELLAHVLHTAAAAGDTGRLESLMAYVEQQEGADCSRLLEEPDAMGRTVLLTAAAAGDAETVSWVSHAGFEDATNPRVSDDPRARSSHTGPLAPGPRRGRVGEG